MKVNRACLHPIAGHSTIPFHRKCARRFSAIFERQRRQIDRLERENERLQRALREEQKKCEQERKRNAELEKENSKLKKDLEASTQQAGNTVLLSTPSAMHPVYSKPPARKRHRKPGRKNGHPGVRRATPVHIDQTVEHKLTECPDCHNPLSAPCGKHTRIVEDIPPVLPTATEHVTYEYYCSPCSKKVSAPVTDALPKATMGLRLTLLSAFLHYALGMTTRNICKWLHTFCQFSVTPGGLVLQWQRLAEILKPVYDGLAIEARLSAVLNIDVSGWRIR